MNNFSGAPGQRAPLIGCLEGYLARLAGQAKEDTEHASGQAAGQIAHRRQLDETKLVNQYLDHLILVKSLNKYRRLEAMLEKKVTRLQQQFQLEQE